MSLDVRYAQLDDYPRLSAFLDTYWAKDHVYIRQRSLFDWTFGRRDVPFRIHDPQRIRDRFHQRAHLHHPLVQRARRGGVTQDVLETARQQRPVDRLRHEIRGAGFERAADRQRILVPGNHDDRHVREARFGAQPAAYLEAIEPRHVDVEQHDGHLARQRGGECIGAVAEGHGFEAHIGDGFGQEDPAEIFVVGDDRKRSWPG